MKYYKYWNDIEEEKKKPYYIDDKSDYKIVNFITNETNLKRCFEDALKFAASIGEIKGHIIDIGAGVAWTSALISPNPISPVCHGGGFFGASTHENSSDSF